MGLVFTIIIVLLWLFLFYRIILFVNKNNNKIDAVFIALLIIALFIPMSNISTTEKSEKENRGLANMPDLFIDGKINNKYGAQFDLWFDDRFNGRRQLIRLYSHIKKSLGLEDNKVLVGNNGWLFYKGEASMDNFQNKILFTQSELVDIAKYLEDINDWARKNGKNFYYVIAPDKNKIYGENITTLKKLRPDSESRANQLVQYLRENTKVKVLYLYDVLMKSKDDELLYYKQDTHWNDFGAYIGYQEIIKFIKSQYPFIQTVSYSGMKRVGWSDGDLKRMIVGFLQNDETQYNKPIIKDTAKCVNAVQDEPESINCYNKNKKLKIFMLRDSFAEALKDYFNNTFNTMSYRTKIDFNTDDLQYIKNNVDIIILEQVERNIHSLKNKKFPKD